MIGILEKLKARKVAPPPVTPPPPPPIDSEAAVTFLALADNFEASRTARDRVHGQLLAATGQLQNARAYLKLVEGDQAIVEGQAARFPADGPGRWALSEVASKVADARRELDRAERAIPPLRFEMDAAESALAETTAALASDLDHASDADRFVSLQAELASRAVAWAEAAFTPAVARKMVARRQTRHPLRLEELEIAMDGRKLAEAEQAVETADATLKAARQRAREGVAARDSFTKAVEAALAYEARGKVR